MSVTSFGSTARASRGSRIWRRSSTMPGSMTIVAGPSRTRLIVDSTVPEAVSTDPTTSTLTTAVIASGESWRSAPMSMFILSSNLRTAPALGGCAFTHLAADGSCWTRATRNQNARQRSKHDRRDRYSQGRSHRGRIAVDEDVVDQLLHLVGHLSRQADWKMEASALAATNLKAGPRRVVDTVDESRSRCGGQLRRIGHRTVMYRGRQLVLQHRADDGDADGTAQLASRIQDSGCGSRKSRRHFAHRFRHYRRNDHAHPDTGQSQGQHERR